MKGRPKGRYFFHDGTAYGLYGNQGLAMSHFHELRAHLHQLKRVNVNQLPIVFGTKEFDDGTVARYQLIHGREKVMVFAPSYRKEQAIELEKVIKMQDERIVPCIMARDNSGFVACLSGTFDGPYLWFPNHDYPWEWLTDKGAYDYDEEDTLKNMTLLSTLSSGETLSFLDPTGMVPDNFNPEVDDGSPDPERTSTTTGWERFICSGWGICILPGVIGSTGGPKFDQVWWWGQPSEIKGDLLAETSVGSSIVTKQHAAQPEDEFTIQNCYDWADIGVSITRAFDYVVTGQQTSLDFFLWQDSVKAKENSMDEFAAAYSRDIDDYNIHYLRTLTCDTSGGMVSFVTTDYPPDSEWTTTGQLVINVDNTEYIIDEWPEHEAVGDTWKYDQGVDALKYYGKGTRPGITALWFGPRNCWGVGFVDVSYVYVHPSSEQQFTVTKFDVLQTNSPRHHIPNVVGMDYDNEPEFDGHIFMGLITYPEETTTKKTG